MGPGTDHTDMREPGITGEVKYPMRSKAGFGARPHFACFPIVDSCRI